MAAEREEVAAGTPVIRQGESGETFYVVESGALRVTVDGVHVRDLGPGDSFGEIALIRDVARTASVEATTPAVLVELHREPFLAAVTGRLEAAAAADEVVRERLGA
jgi:CRP-like cAMP-binding protein